MKKRVYFFTQGCKINIYDTQVLKDMFEKQQYEIVDDVMNADLVVVNSCTVTAKADNKFKHYIKSVKKKNPDILIATVGCYTELNSSKIAEEIPAIDIMLGSQNKFILPELINNYSKTDKPYINVEKKDISFFDYNLSLATDHTRAFLKIQDGCDNFCTYCTIAKARGKSRSKPVKSVLKDVTDLVTNGYKEIVISGIDLGSYLANHENKCYDLLSIIKSMLKIPGFRLRISSIEPWCFSDEMIEFFISNDRICPHLHIPLQSASDIVLKRMNRKYNINTFKNIIEKLSKQKKLMISTDIIVGFPGETEDDFKKSYDFLKTTPLTYAHVFSYSDRPLAAANKIYPKTPSKVIKTRSQILRKLSDEKKEAFYENNINEVLEIIIEKKYNNDYFGVSENYIPVKFSSEKNYIKGDLLKVKLTSLKDKNVIAVEI